MWKLDAAAAAAAVAVLACHLRSDRVVVVGLLLVAVLKACKAVAAARRSRCRHTLALVIPLLSMAVALLQPHTRWTAVVLLTLVVEFALEARATRRNSVLPFCS